MLTHKTPAKLALTTLTLLMAISLVLIGCSRSPLDPAQSATSEPTLLTRAVDRNAGEASAAPVNLYTEAVISAETGGRLELLDVMLEVPPGAVPNDTTFSVFIPDDAVFYNEFGTDGLAFDVPVRVTMSYRDANLTGVDETSIRIGYFNEETGAIEDVQCQVDLLRRTVTAELTHFSAYGLISD